MPARPLLVDPIIEEVVKSPSNHTGSRAYLNDQTKQNQDTHTHRDIHGCVLMHTCVEVI